MARCPSEQTGYTNVVYGLCCRTSVALLGLVVTTVHNENTFFIWLWEPLPCSTLIDLSTFFKLAKGMTCKRAIFGRESNEYKYLSCRVARHHYYGVYLIKMKPFIKRVRIENVLTHQNV